LQITKAGKELFVMARGDKSAYTDKQERMAEHIEESYEQRGVPEAEAERRAWATVNKETGGGRRTAAGRHNANERLTEREHANPPDAEHRARSEAARKGWETRRQKAAH
jgi:plasmid stabilization system protein ParE